MSETRVRFVEGGSGVLSVLEIEACNAPRLLEAVTRELFDQRVQVVQSRISRRSGQLCMQLSVVEFDGAPISSKRRLAVQAAVFDAVDSVRAESRARRSDRASFIPDEPASISSTL